MKVGLNVWGSIGMKRYRMRVFIFDVFFVFLMATFIILYGHLIEYYVEHALFIVFIFVIILTASIYVYDDIRQILHRRIIGLTVRIQGLNSYKTLPKIISIHETRRKNHQLVYRCKGYNIPVCFIERVDHEKAVLYPFYKENLNSDCLFEIVENYRYEFFLVKDDNHNKYIINREQVLYVE